jgi:N4-gp56 family major capsid protein
MASNNTTAVLAPEVQTYYEKVFLERGNYALVLDQGAQKRTQAGGAGRTINFTRRDNIAITSTPLTEGTNPSGSAISSSTVSVTLSEYGFSTTTSKLVSLVGIDQNMKETVEQVGQQQGETLNRVVRTELENGTAYIPNAHTTADWAAGDIISASAIRTIVKNLELKNAIPYADGMFLGKTNPYSKFNLLADTAWLNAKTYSDVKDLYKGEMGELYQVRFINNKDVASQVGVASVAASAVTTYNTYVHGDHAIGTFDLAGDKPRLYIYEGIDSGNVAGRAAYVSWAGTYAAKILNANWVVKGQFTAA